MELMYIDINNHIQSNKHNDIHFFFDDKQNRREKNGVLTEGVSFGALNEEGIAALFDSGSKRSIKDQTIRAHFLGHFASVAIIVLIALARIDVISIVGRAGELLCRCHTYVKGKI